MSETIFDLAIVGAGPGGYISAIRAAQRGLAVALVEEKDPGGTCLHTGCIPTKARVASAALLRRARAATQWGLHVPTAGASLTDLRTREQKIVRQLAAGVKNLLEKNQVRVFHGRGCLRSAHEIEVRDAPGNTAATIAHPRAILLATGSRPAELPIAPRDGTTILNSDDLLALTELPAELLIIGGGYIGCEFASVFNALGSRVTVIEALDRLLPNLDQELGQFLERAFKKAGINVRLNAKVEEVRAITSQSGWTGHRPATPATPGSGADHGEVFETHTRRQVEVRLAGDSSLRGDKLLVSVGRVPNTENLGLENAGVKLDGRWVAVNEFMETNVRGIYAIGDVTGKMALAHVAGAQGRVVIENLVAGRDGRPCQPMHYDAAPACVFTDPEVAGVGLTEADAARRGLAVRVGRFYFAALGKAQAAGETEGLVKLIADAQTGRLLGGHILGAHAAELIGTITLAVQLGATAAQLTETVFAHPTLGEAILEAAEALFGKATHAFTRR